MMIKDEEGRNYYSSTAIMIALGLGLLVGAILAGSIILEDQREAENEIYSLHTGGNLVIETDADLQDSINCLRQNLNNRYAVYEEDTQLVIVREEDGPGSFHSNRLDDCLENYTISENRGY